MFDWLSKRRASPEKVLAQAETELSAFLAILEEHASGEQEDFVASRSLWAMTFVQAADFAENLYSQTKGRINLLHPRDALSNYPTLLHEVTEAALKLQRTGHKFMAPGPMVWVHTLRAVRMPQLLPAAKHMWKCIGLGGSLMHQQAQRQYLDLIGRSDFINPLFLREPEGFAD